MLVPETTTLSLSIVSKLDPTSFSRIIRSTKWLKEKIYSSRYLRIGSFDDVLSIYFKNTKEVMLITSRFRSKTESKSDRITYRLEELETVMKKELRFLSWDLISIEPLIDRELDVKEFKQFQTEVFEKLENYHIAANNLDIKAFSDYCEDIEKLLKVVKTGIVTLPSNLKQVPSNLPKGVNYSVHNEKDAVFAIRLLLPQAVDYLLYINFECTERVYKEIENILKRLFNGEGINQQTAIYLFHQSRIMEVKELFSGGIHFPNITTKGSDLFVIPMMNHLLVAYVFQPLETYESNFSIHWKLVQNIEDFKDFYRNTVKKVSLSYLVPSIAMNRLITSFTTLIFYHFADRATNFCLFPTIKLFTYVLYGVIKYTTAKILMEEKKEGAANIAIAK